MWRRVLALGAAFAFVASMSYAGTVTRGTKSAGGTDFTDGTTIVTDEVNTDFNTLYTLVNGQLDTDNIATDGVDSAEIAADAVGASEIATGAVTTTEILDSTIADVDIGTVTGEAIQDYSNDAAEAALSVDPGTTGSESLATDLEGEIERLRYVIARLAVGITADTTSNQAWFDGPIRGGSFIYNGGFESTDGTGDTSASTAPHNWGDFATPASIAYSDPTDVSEGEGVSLILTGEAGGTDEGISQSVSGLKASTDYMVIARVKPTAGDGCTLRATDTSPQTVDADTISDGAYETLALIITSTSTPHDITVRLLTEGNGDVCEWDHVGFYEINDDPIPRPGPIIMSDTDSSGTDALTAGLGVFEAITDIENQTINIPEDGGTIIVMGTFCAQNSGGNGEVGVRITENCNGSGASSVAQAYGNNSWTDANICTTIFFVSNMTARIAGDSCEYALEAAEIVDSTWTYPQDGTNSFSARWIPAR